LADDATQQAQRTPCIDFHVHPSPALYQVKLHKWVTDWFKLSHPNGDFEEFCEKYSDPGRFEEFLAGEGVDFACVLAELNEMTVGVCTNEQVRDFCRGRSRLIPFCNVNPYLFARPADELKRLVEEEGFRGLKLYPTYQQYFLNDSRIYPIYAMAQNLGIPVLIHTGSSIFPGTRLKYGDPLHLDDVAVDFPDLKLVMAHSGRGFWYDRAFFMSRLHKNVYMEISGLPPSKLLEYFPELGRNTEKVIFGSDWPGVPNIRGNRDAVAALPLPPGAAEKILGGNAARVLKMR
jgi:hypothetical protein